MLVTIAFAGQLQVLWNPLLTPSSCFNRLQNVPKDATGRVSNPSQCYASSIDLNLGWWQKSLLILSVYTSHFSVNSYLIPVNFHYYSAVETLKVKCMPVSTPKSFKAAAWIISHAFRIHKQPPNRSKHLHVVLPGSNIYSDIWFAELCSVMFSKILTWQSTATVFVYGPLVWFHYADKIRSLSTTWDSPKIMAARCNKIVGHCLKYHSDDGE